MPRPTLRANLAANGIRERMPISVAPMLATLSLNLPADPQHYSFEFKWDGVRALMHWDGRSMTIRSRNQLDITRRYPELHSLKDALEDHRVVLDGEIIAVDEDDRPSFPLLQQRMHVEGPAAIARLVKQVPVHYVLFDLLYLDGRSLTPLPLTRRRELLEELTLLGPNWRVSPAIVGDGEPMLETAKLHQLEGVVAKRLDSVYEPGRRSPAWKKIKLVNREEFVVGGWTTEEGSPRNVGALHLGYYERPGAPKMRYAGGVGSGFKARDLDALGRILKQLSTTTNPFSDPLPRRDIHFVKPSLVIEVEYRRWPAGGRIQQGAFKGVRTDKAAAEVVREDPSRCTR
jgi:bifunctional non-homologous end joining protein LigD